MALNRDAFIGNYLDELEENLSLVDTAILALKKDPEKDDELARLLRALHTIKGSSRMLKFGKVEEISHGLENVFKGVKEGRYGISKNLVQLVFITADYIRMAAKGIRERKDDSLDTAKLQAVFEKAYADEPYEIAELRQPSEEGGASPTGVPDASSPTSAPESVPASGRTKMPLMEGEPEKSYETIRINVGKIEGIVRLLNNLIIKQFQFRKEKDLLAELEENLRATGAGMDSLKLVQQVRKGFGEELSLLERDTFELQENILSLRMLPLELILGNLGKMVEETAMIMDKEIEFVTRGTDLLLDKFILERLHDPIIHIVRNAIDHGIETPGEREAAGKSRSGKLDISCTAESGNIVMRILDDGRGFDYDKIRKKAIAMNPGTEDEIREMDDTSLNSFLFMSGFSTKDTITDLSGRGVGLDIVKHNLERIKGKISLLSETGKGTEFKLSLPLSLATVDGFFVSAAGEKFLIPSAYVKEIIIVDRGEQLDLLNRKGFRLRNAIVPLYPLAAILDKGLQEEEPVKQFVVVVESLGETIGIVVEAVIQYTSLIYKPVPKNMAGIKLIQGIVFDESFNIINILYIPEIMNRFKRIRNIDTHRRFSSSRREFKKILVVDDSFSTREIEKSILELENYAVTTAVDGIDGLDKLKEQKYHLIITDIHMPRMDGLTFVENLRKDENYRQVPIIVVSSDEDPEKRRRFEVVGANAFIVKADFDRGNLVARVKDLIG